MGTGCGTVFNLHPPQHVSGHFLATWSETVLYHFQGGNDAASPEDADLVFDQAGNLYGTVFGLTAGTWAFSLLYGLGAPGTGQVPEGALIMDSSGNLYGTANSGGAYGFGAVFKLTPGAGGWTYTWIHDFCGGGYPPCSDGYTPSGSLAIDSSGNLYGRTANGGAYGGGVVYQITP